MRPVIEMISRVAPSDANVLITGENGTGKGLVAQALHALSPRASRTMDEGTLFMDEIANIPLAQQAKLLRVIETGDFERVGSSKTLHANVRIISATNSNLQDEVAAGRFRQDLLFRLNTIQIALPPLRDRREDIMLLANSFLRQHTQRYRKQISGFNETAREVATAPFPRKRSRARSCDRTSRAHGARSTNKKKAVADRPAGSDPIVSATC